MTIYATSPNGSPSQVYYGCNRNWRANTVYRMLSVPSSTTCKPTPSCLYVYLPDLRCLCIASSKATTAASDPTGSVTKTTSPNGPTSTEASPSANPVIPAPETSRAWIAGAVVGPVAGCILVALLVWGIMRYRMKKATAAARVSELPERTSGTYNNRQSVSPWPVSQLPPQDGTMPSYGWDSRHKSTTPVPGAAHGSPPHELSSDPGNFHRHVVS